MKTYDLRGNWKFTYSPEYNAAEPTGAFDREIAVPAHWDDQMQAFEGLELRTNPDYEPIPYPMGDNCDASLPYIVGTVWYEREVEIEDECPFAELTLLGVWTEARVWANGHYVGRAFGYSTPHAFSLDGYLKPGKNTIRIAVDNDPHEHLGCITRGWKGFTGGLCRTVELRVTGRCRIKDAAAFARDAKFFTLDTLFDGDTTAAELQYKVCDGDQIVKSGTFPVDGNALRRDIPAMGLEPWSDTNPKMYTLKLALFNRDGTADKMELPFGFRVFDRKGMTLYLNGKPIFLRGATEHAYYPETCTAPDNVDAYLKTLGILRDWGFNFMRFHTSVPNEEYMTAMDRLGFLVQVEAPVAFTLDEWEDILRTCRRHPCIAVMCGGNEELLDEDKIAYLGRAAQLAHTIAPATLFNPQEALRGIEYGWGDADQGEDNLKLDLPDGRHVRWNMRRLAMLKRFSDVFGQYSWGYMSYDSSAGNNHILDSLYPVYERPLLSHELGIYGSYIDLSLENRYEGTRIGTGMYKLAREYMTREGIIENWKTYWKNSCYYQASVRKANIETARKCRGLAGFDYLGAIDHHWHHTGYQCGVLNEFYEEKPGCPKDSVLAWNSATVLLLDNQSRYTFSCGEKYSCPILLSHFGADDLAEGGIIWTLLDEAGHMAAKGLLNAAAVKVGKVEELATLELTLPDKQGKYRLNLSYTSGSTTVRNSWNLWCFDTTAAASGVRTVEKLTDADIAALENGENLLLCTAAPFPAQEIGFQPMPSGRPLGMVATVISEHPAFEAFPHDGWCDWQFASLMNGGAAVRWGTVNAPENPAEFAPIVDVCMGYKQAGRFAAVCEFAVGKGRLLVCGFNLAGDAPEQLAMKNAFLTYLANPTASAPTLAASDLRAFLAGNWEMARAEVDKGFDKAGQKAL